MEIRPCPFCGSADTGLTRNEVARGRYYVECGECQAQGPHVNDLDKAVDAWNVVYEESLLSAWEGDEEDASPSPRPPD
jgi:Lar family restriction alleviation protein